MNRFITNKENFPSLASKMGAHKELNGQSENSMDPVDRNIISENVIKFNKDSLAWGTDDMSYNHCIRFDSFNLFHDNDNNYNLNLKRDT
jgi:hypothetical protein